jgi:hypothetical protein
MSRRAFDLTQYLMNSMCARPIGMTHLLSLLVLHCCEQICCGVRAFDSLLLDRWSNAVLTQGETEAAHEGEIARQVSHSISIIALVPELIRASHAIKEFLNAASSNSEELNARHRHE